MVEVGDWLEEIVNMGRPILGSCFPFIGKYIIPDNFSLKIGSKNIVYLSKSKPVLLNK